MNLQLINTRSRCCTLLGKTNITKEITCRCEENRILEVLSEITEKDISDKIAVLEKDVQIYLFQEKDSLKYLLELLGMGVSIYAVGNLLKYTHIKDLMEYDVKDVGNLLLSWKNKEIFFGIYLRYYRTDGLSEEEMSRLWNGLEWFQCRRTSLTDEWIGDIGEKRSIFMEPIITDNYVSRIEDYDECLKLLADSKETVCFLNELYLHSDSRSKPDEHNLKEIYGNVNRLIPLWSWLCRFMEKEQLANFLQLWLSNHALVYDLEFFKRKVEREQGMDINSFLANRASYIAFLYNEKFIGEIDEGQEELLIFAITRRKRAFLRLVRENFDLYTSIPCNSVLFQRLFYEKCININSMNKKNLAACRNMLNSNFIPWQLLAEKEYTFEEMELLYCRSEEQIRLYHSFSSLRTDARLRIMREIVKKQCLPYGIRQEELSKNLMIKPLSCWMREDFNHIKDLTYKNVVYILSEYEMFSRFIPDIEKDTEVIYIWNNMEKCKNLASMEEVWKQALEDEEWKYLVRIFEFPEEFIEENLYRIRKFIFEGGAHIMKIYYELQQNKLNELRCLTSAELMGRFKELKYYQDDLLKEIDFPITDGQKQIWMENSRIKRDELEVWEEDGLLPVMQIGEIPHRTCLSYIDGIYKQCLLACHDANKKVIYMSYKGKVVLRAAVRLTKGMFGRISENKKISLKFADFMAPDECDRADKDEKEREKLTLFLESSYISGLPENLQQKAAELLVYLMRKKASQMGAILAVSILV